METTQIVAMIASLLGVFGPAAQFAHVWRTKSTKGLSLPTFVILNLSLMCSLVLAFQYRLFPGLLFAFIAWIVKLAVLWQLSARAMFSLIGLGIGVAAGVRFGPPIFAEVVLTTHYSELVAFAWGLLLAIAFLPQVWMSHRTRNTRNLSLPGLAISAVSTTLWDTFALMVSNYSMLFWCSVMLISLLELIRLKLGVRMAGADALPAPNAEGA